MLCGGGVGDGFEACAVLVEEFSLSVDLQKLETLLQVWVHNAFAHEDEPPSSAIYFLPSFMSHSCLPSIAWYCTEEKIYVLRARRAISPGDEVTVSYLDEQSLLNAG